MGMKQQKTINFNLNQNQNYELINLKWIGYLSATSVYGDHDKFVNHVIKYGQFVILLIFCVPVKPQDYLLSLKEELAASLQRNLLMKILNYLKNIIYPYIFLELLAYMDQKEIFLREFNLEISQE